MSCLTETFDELELEKQLLTISETATGAERQAVRTCLVRCILELFIQISVRLISNDMVEIEAHRATCSSLEHSERDRAFRRLVAFEAFKRVIGYGG